MTDKELLELAAKAAGIMHKWHDEVMVATFNDGIGWLEWNPLTDDGDALRLAVKLGLCVTIDMGLGHETEAWGYNEMAGKVIQDHNNDPYAATRRAIVRAAVEVGRNYVP
mgnify:CR=1 FL=1